MPKGYIIAHITVRNPESYQEYVRLDTPIIEGYGGRFIVRGGQSRTMEGETFARHVVIEFADYASALACHTSPEYQKVADIRRAHADSVIVVVEGHPA
jgi:uncharacterized protein (DUF1330 family)